MEISNLTKVKKLTISAAVMALYISTVYATSSFSFGAYQIRIATAIYALSYFFPFLVLPLGLANALSNAFFGSLGILDIVGGGVVGLLTSYFIVRIRKCNLSSWLVILPILLVPTFCVSLWLSVLLHIPYHVLILSVGIGQAFPSVVGALLIKALRHCLKELQL
ncbi:MAG: QueT transporter family protein [Clostridia bacterium]|nr:QueT transporter family protein [Clostridia bacterium]